MKLIKVEYLEESSEAIFFDVTFEKTYFFKQNKIYTKRCFLEKTGTKSYFKFSDNTGGYNFDSAIIQEMILQYEKNKL